MSALRQLARRVGLGHVIRLLYRRPLGLARKSVREGGPLQQRRTEAGRLQMMQAATALPPLSASGAEAGHEVHFLTGTRFWYQSLFCFYSLQLHAGKRLTPVFHDDGTLTEEDQSQVLRVVPWTRFVQQAEIMHRLDEALPETRFPALRARRLEYPHLRKITDIHAGTSGWKLVLDSDMLCFREPRFVLEWLANPDRACHMVDVERFYGYSEQLMERLAGQPIPDLINVGLCGLDSGNIDWEEMERWCQVLLEEEGASYFQEQALVAMLMAGRERAVAPARDYRVLPSLEEGRQPTAVMHHYVAESKRSYFQHGWRRVWREAMPASSLPVCPECQQA